MTRRELLSTAISLNVAQNYFRAAFVAAFVVYKGLIFGFGVAMGSSVGHFDSLLATLPRIFLINACVFNGLGALYALGSAVRRNSEAVALAPRHV